AFFQLRRIQNGGASTLTGATSTASLWTALRARLAGWLLPVASVARAIRVKRPSAAGCQSRWKRCHDHCDRGASEAARQFVPPSVLTSTWVTPAAAHAQPQISTVRSGRRASGGGDTMTDSGWASQTGR